MELCRSSVALGKLSDPAFQQFWDELYESCPWKTCFQARAYVETWYRCYQHVVEPVVVFSLDPDHPAILALANSPDGLVVAGSRQAEYHCWLAPRADPDFLAELSRLLSSEFRWNHLTFRYLPAGFPTEVLPTSIAEVKEYGRPLMQVSSTEAISASLRKKGNKSKLNGLKKHGELHFEHITEVERLLIFLDDIIAMYEFRQGAINRSVPFEGDSRKRAFLLAMAQIPALTHSTILRVGDKAVAAHLGRITTDKVHLGIFAHSASYAQYSPGKLHLLFLGQMLHDQGFSFLDLTPGEDEWKERFASEHDSVFILRMHRSVAVTRVKKFQSQFWQTSKQILRRVRISGQDRPSLKRGNGISLIRSLSSWVWSHQKVAIYHWKGLETAGKNPVSRAARDEVRELMHFKPHKPYSDRFQFLSVCLNRLESEQHVYTRQEGNILVQYAWLAVRERLALPEFGCEILLGKKSAVLFDFYLSPCTSSPITQFQAIIAQMLSDTSRTSEVEDIYIVVWGEDLRLSRAAEQLDFRPHSELCSTVRLGRKRKWSSNGGLSTETDIAICESSDP